jgi:hypothetical protein
MWLLFVHLDVFTELFIFLVKVRSTKGIVQLKFLEATKIVQSSELVGPASGKRTGKQHVYMMF